jgi:hypothetical protein
MSDIYICNGNQIKGYFSSGEVQFENNIEEVEFTTQQYNIMTMNSGASFNTKCVGGKKPYHKFVLALDKNSILNKIDITWIGNGQSWCGDYMAHNTDSFSVLLNGEWTDLVCYYTAGNEKRYSIQGKSECAPYISSNCLYLGAYAGDYGSPNYLTDIYLKVTLYDIAWPKGKVFALGV